MDLRLATEAFARLNLASSRNLGAASRAALQSRQLYLPSASLRQQTSTRRCSQQRSFSHSPWRHAPGAGSAAARAPSADELDEGSALPQRPTPPRPDLRRRTREPNLSTEMPSDDEIASFVDRSFELEEERNKKLRSRRPLSWNPPPHLRDFGAKSNDSTRTGRASGASEKPSDASSRRFDHPLGPNRSQDKYFGRKALPEEDGDMVDRFEAAMRRDPLMQDRPGSAAGIIDQFQVKPRDQAQSIEDAERDALTDMILTPQAPPPPKPLPKSSLRLGPSVGRSIAVDPTRGLDVSRGLKILEMRLSANRVRSQFYKQRFHERPGLRRKRLKSERWRAKFKAGFREMVSRVRYLTKQGW